MRGRESAGERGEGEKNTRDYFRVTMGQEQGIMGSLLGWTWSARDDGNTVLVNGG